uniref:Protein FAR1-related sequence 5-like n=1 Tax=Tanacetum cinerariifolium TaxID=118510 RepID=A0A6L2M0T7_TANCI|nr:protein FAR1-related sequence 5-like [Tanacetum cinerariifolium]
MPALEDVGTFQFSNEDEDDDAVADMNNLETTIQVSPTPTLRIHKDHHLDQVIGDLHSATQRRNMSKILEEHGFMNVKSAFLYGKIEEEVYVCQPPGFEDPDSPDRVYKVEKALYILHQALRSWYETMLTYLLDNGFQREVKNASIPIENQKHLLKDEDGEEVDVHMYRSMIGSLTYLTSSRPDIMFAMYLKGQAKLGLCYLKDSLFDLVAYTDSDYAGASLDRKSTTGGCQFLGCRLISWQCKKQTLVANSTIEAQYVAALSCCGQVLWIQNQLLDYGDCNEKKLIQMVKIHTDKNVADLLAKAFDVVILNTVELMLLVILNTARYAVTVNPTIYDSCIEQFWSTAIAKTINGEAQIHAWIDGKEIIITESSVLRDLQLADEEGVDCLLNSTVFENLELIGKSKRKNTQVPQPSVSTKNVADEAFYKKLDDRLVRAATTASSLEAEQDSGGGPRCQEAMRDTIAQTRFENVSKLSNDSLLTRGNTLRSDEDRMKLNELMELCTNLQSRVLDLEKINTTQALEITSLKRRVKKLEKNQRSRTHKLKRLYKVGLSARVDSFEDEQSLGEDASKEERKIDDIDQDEDITLVNDQDDAEVFDANDLHGEEVTTAEEQQELISEEKATLFMQLLEKRRKFFAASRVEDKRNKPPTQAQQRKIMCTYLNNVEGKKLKDLKNKSFDSIQKMFDRAFKRVNTFVDFRTVLVEGSSKRAEEELTQESAKKQKASKTMTRLQDPTWVSGRLNNFLVLNSSLDGVDVNQNKDEHLWIDDSDNNYILEPYEEEVEPHVFDLTMQDEEETEPTFVFDETMRYSIIGKTFDNSDVAYNFYNQYGLSKGFGTRKHKVSRRKVTNEIYSRIFVCNKEGFKDMNDKRRLGDDVKRHSITRMGYKAMIQVTSSKHGEWVVKKFNDEHNHPLDIPSHVIKQHSHSIFHRSSECRDIVTLLSKAGLKSSDITKIVNAFRGNEEDKLTRVQCSNIVNNEKKSNIGKECHMIIMHFKEKAEKDHDFYFAMHLKEDGTFESVFWADGRSRSSYCKFGNVVVFDTTYQTNKFSLPFALFVGVNHHGQSILLGTALLENETEITFTWLFKEFLNCMHDCPPISIITDQDVAMGKSIAKVFPKIKHRFCAWHIQKHRKLVTSIPNHYLLPRWTMKATFMDENTGISWGGTINNGSEEISLLTIWLIRSKVNKVLEDGRDSLTEIMKLNTCLNGILHEQNKRKKTIVELNSNIGSTSLVPTQQGNSQQNIISDPIIPVKTKGRPKVATRIKLGIKVVNDSKKKRTCSYCGGKGHHVTGCQKKKASKTTAHLQDPTWVSDGVYDVVICLQLKFDVV